MTVDSQTPPVRRGTLRTQILNEMRRVRDGLDPDDVYAHLVRLQARIDLLELQLRHAAASAILDATLHQAAEIRRQALEAAEHTYGDIVSAAEEEAARLRQDARRLLEEAHAEIRRIHDRIGSLMPHHERAGLVCLHDHDPQAHHAALDRTEQPCRSTTSAGATPMPRQRPADGSTLDCACDEPPFRLPTWIEA